MQLIKQSKNKRKVYYDSELNIVRKIYQNKSPEEIEFLVCAIQDCFPGMYLDSGKDFIDIKYIDAKNYYINMNADTDKMIDFWWNEFERITELGYTYCDWNASNTLVLDNGFMLIDYDSLYTLNRIERSKLSFIHHANKFNPNHTAIEYVHLY